MDWQKNETLDLTQRIEKINEFLSQFDNPLVIQLPEKWQPNPKWFWTHKDSLELIAWNLDWKFWIHFCPNWDWWKINTVWEKLIRSEWKQSSDAKLTCFVFDFDYKDLSDRYESKEVMLEEIKNKCRLWQYKPTYIFDSWGWAHVYFMFNKDDISSINNVFSLDLLYKVSSYAARLRWADQACWATCRISWCIRVPYSYNNKYSPAKIVEQYYINEDSGRLDLSTIEALVDVILSEEETIKQKKSLDISYWAQTDILKINMVDMTERLQKYPRVYEDWTQEIIKIDKTQVIKYQWHLNENWDFVSEQTIKWNSYKYNIDNNYINCFYLWWDRKQCPLWNWFGYLYNYFFWDKNKVEEFLQTEYWLSINIIKQGKTISEIEVESKWLKIMFTETWVIRSVKWSDSTQRLFDWVIIPKWKWKVRQMKVWESDSEHMAYIFNVNWEDNLVIKTSTKKEHNKKYGFMFCYQWDNQLNEFFNAIDTNEDIPWINIYEKNWYFEWVTILWWEAIDWSLNWWLIQTQYWFKLVSEDLQQITVKEYLDEYLKIYDRTISIPTLLQTLALAWMNKREWHNTYPWLLVTGLTGSGKSSIMFLMMKMLGYWETSRRFSLPGMTPQPLKHAASDYSILFLEELTNRVWETTEELLRNVINRDKASRWLLDDNIEFNLSSPLFIVWERALKDESLNNRFMTVVINKRNWIEWARDRITELEWKTAWFDIYRTRSTVDKEWLNTRANELSRMLSNNWIEPRNADTFSYMFLMNELFELWIDDDELIKIVKMWIKKTWVAQTSHLDDKWVIRSYLVKSVMNNKANVTVTSEWNRVHVECIWLDDWWYEKTKSALNTAIVNFNDELWYDAFETSAEWLTCDFDSIIKAWGWYVDECKTICEFRQATLWGMRWNSRCFHMQADFDI